MRTLGSIQLRTEIPGPRSKELSQWRERVVARGLSTSASVFVDRAHGALLVDVDGNTFIDFAGGISSLNVGHTPDLVVRSLQQQAERFIHPVAHVAMYEGYLALAQRLNDLVPGDFPKKTLLLNSGAEAVENAIKLARHYTGRPGVIAFDRGFHGRTLLGMSLTGKVKSLKGGFGPMATDIYRLPYPYPFRDHLSRADMMESFQHLFEYQVAPTDIAAMIMEPVQGDGGLIPATEEFVQTVKSVCDEYGILLIADEVQTGFGRTGRWFAMEHFGVAADLTVMGKSLAAGIPLSAVTGRAEIMDSPGPKYIGGTLAGSPIGCATALSVIQMIEDMNLVERAQAIGQQMNQALQFPSGKVGEVRGLGAMIGIELVTDLDSRQPDADFTQRVVHGCLKRGLITITAGNHGNVIRLLPPLVIEDAELQEGMAILVATIRDLERGNEV